MSYHPYAANWDWRANPQLNMGYGQYNMQYPVGAANVSSMMSYSYQFTDSITCFFSFSKKKKTCSFFHLVD